MADRRMCFDGRRALVPAQPSHLIMTAQSADRPGGMMSPAPPELTSGDVFAYPRRSARHRRLTRWTVVLAALSAALLHAAAPQASAATHKELLNNRLYVVNAYADTVSVIDTRTNTVVGSPIPVGDDPGAVATDTLRGRAYVTNRLSNTVSVIDTRADTVVGSPIAVGGLPAGVATDPLRGRAYVTNANSGTVSVIDTNTNTVIGSPIAVGSTPGAVATDTLRGRAYVTNGGSDTVSVIDT
ncbi:YncE family protein, partial [Streptomyces sp. NPDC056390]|uniref:YncE family protein n=1 Tax=Streptomyces sp. NPDC056390 TaxID=3345806 RepID=UPI0035E0B7AD